ncbi:MAG TPA: EAL domain-containing protein [Arenimonas sp.]|nr:EAL domain-containing protein [Arenimonas sp.]
MSNNDDELLQFDDDEAGTAAEDTAGEPWRILIVDDEEQVHQVTRFALRDTRILDRPLSFDSVYSADEARQRLAARERYACILLDVVMESDDAGLRLVGDIRDRFMDKAVRIVLRTGQPGYAPEVEVIQRYDINDYRAKSELTAHRLLSTLTTALRSYQQIRTIEQTREGLEMILEAATSLMAVTAVRHLAEGVLLQICSILQIDADGVVCAQQHRGGGDEDALSVLAASGRFGEQQGRPLDELGNAVVSDRIRTALRIGASEFGRDYAVLYIRSPRSEALVVHVATQHPLGELDRKLLEIFSVNIAVGFDNAQLFEELQAMAFHDRLTGLWNRPAVERELARRIAQGAPLAVVIADIDNFQAVNDGLGHEIGDLTLKAAATILAEIFGQGVFMARNSADSFALILQNLEAGELEARLRALQRRLERNIEIEGNEIPLTMSVGVACHPEHGSNAQSVFQNAGIALKQAKRVSRSAYQIFDNRFEQELQQRLQTIRELRHSVERKALRLLYQPQVDLKSGKVFGCEALVRWLRDGESMLAPDLFIPAAEDSGHIVAMGAWILREACEQQQRWLREHGVALNMAVNVSMRQLKDPEFVDIVLRTVAETGIQPECLELEVTESMMMEDTRDMISVLGRLRAAGIRVAIDDFGTGYSSLSHLQRLPIDRLKIDRAFITGLTQRSEDEVIAAMIINMGHLLNLRVIAEGVETEEQQRQLIGMGCDDAQGYYYGKPLAAADLLALAKQKQ